MSEQEAKMPYFKVVRANDCIWLEDKRGEGMSIHMVPSQAARVAHSLLKAAEAKGGCDIDVP